MPAAANRPVPNSTKLLGSGVVPLMGALLTVNRRSAGAVQHSEYSSVKLYMPAEAAFTVNGELEKPVGPGALTTLPNPAMFRTAPSSWPTTRLLLPAFRKRLPLMTSSRLSAVPLGLNPLTWLLKVGLLRNPTTVYGDGPLVKSMPKAPMVKDALASPAPWFAGSAALFGLGMPV